MYKVIRQLSAPGAGTGGSENKQEHADQAAVPEGDVQPKGIFKGKKDSTSRDQGQV